MDTATPARSRPDFRPVRQPRSFRTGQSCDSGRRQQSRPRIRRGRRRAPVHGPGFWGLPVRHRRPLIHRLYRLVGPDDPGPCASASSIGGGRGARSGFKLWRTDSERNRNRGDRGKRGSIDRESAVRFVGDRGGHVGGTRGARGHGPVEDYQNDRTLPRPHRLPFSPGGIGGDHARQPQQPWRDRGGRARHDPLPVQ